MTGQQETNALKNAAADAFKCAFGAVISISPDDAGAVVIDGRQEPVSVASVSINNLSAQCVVHGPHDVLLRVLNADRALESAYLSGRIRIEGDMSVMARMEINESR